MALRNLSRNKRRTLITALAVALGALSIVILQGVTNGYISNIIEATVLSKVGAVQVFRKGYLGSEEPLKMSLPDDIQFVSRIRAVPGVTAVAPRINFDGMVSNGSESTMFLATAVNPELEYKVCPNRETRVAPGSQPLRPGREDEVLIGKTLADSMSAQKNTALVMQAAGPYASVNALDVEVLGFLPTQNMLESKRQATVHLDFAQELLGMQGQVTQYVIAVTELNQAEAIAQRIRTALGDGYEVTTWGDQDPQTRSRVSAIVYVMIFVAFVLFLLVATGIINTMLMAVSERVREIGTMLALGVRRWQVTLLFLLEASTLGLFSAGVGTGAGWALVRLLARHGVMIKQPGGDPTRLYPYIDGRFLLLVMVFALLGTILSALYPAWKAARLRPVEALRAT